ncbi:hypothetical protein BBF96_15370 [Anoxybacter fermentans]|uniref:Uncharacterized protein n=1 Tax=Anoxybacter fermentans TaxID=1323375 RepID=A0A3S9T270_9FIRM|nr:CBO2463/CBO2479 domain-containing protein [Anoxybacter fermentans]AZR74633.1 hypothetical protein BBF96_15370 [Anoxybacter fermentans]
MKYGDKIIDMRGIVVEVHEGSISIDLKGRLGFLKVPLRMVISDHPIKVGQEVGFKMSFIEVLGPEINEHYVSNIEKRNRKMKKKEDE